MPSKVASKGYIYRKFKANPFVSTLSRKKFRALKEQVVQTINSNKTFEPGKKLNMLNPKQISVIQALITTVKARIENGTFNPLNTQTQEAIVFFIAPVYSMQNKAVQIDAQAF